MKFLRTLGVAILLGSCSLVLSGCAWVTLAALTADLAVNSSELLERTFGLASKEEKDKRARLFDVNVNNNTSPVTVNVTFRGTAGGRPEIADQEMVSDEPPTEQGASRAERCMTGDEPCYPRNIPIWDGR